MTVQIAIDGKSYSIGRRNLMDLMTYGKEAAINNLSWYQSSVDVVRQHILGTKTHKDILIELDQLIRAEGNGQNKGADIIAGLAKLNAAKTSNSEAKLKEFLGNLQVKVGNCGDSSSDLELSISDKPDPNYKKTIHTTTHVVLPHQLFATSDDGISRLKPMVVANGELERYAGFLRFFKHEKRDEVIEILNSLTLCNTSLAFQDAISNLLKLVDEDQRELFDKDLRIAVNDNNETSVIDLYLDNMRHSHGVTIKLHFEFVPVGTLLSRSGVVFKLSTEAIEDERFFAFMSLFDPNDYNQVVNVVGDIAKANGSLAFEEGLLKLEKLVAEDQKNAFHKYFQFAVMEESGTSAVLTSFSDLSIAEHLFEGKYVPNSQIFNAKGVNDDNQPPIFQLRKIGDDNNLRLPIDVKINPSIRQDLQSRYDQCISASVEEKQFGQMKKDLHRSEEWLPASSEDEDILTKGKYRELVVTNFNYSGEIVAEDLDFRQKFLAASLKEKASFVTELEKYEALFFQCCVNAGEEVVDVGDFQEKLMAASLGVLSSFMAELEKWRGDNSKKTNLMLEFLKFDIAKQLRLKETSFFVGDNLQFYGTIEQFKKCFLKLTNEKQALMVIAQTQTNKAPLKALGTHFASFGPTNDFLDIERSPYKIKPIRRSSTNDKVCIEVQKSNSFKHFEGKDPNIIAHEDVSGIYSVSFKKEQQIVGADVKLFGSDSRLIIPNKDGSIPLNCPRTPAKSRSVIPTTPMLAQVNEQIENEHFEFQLQQLHRNHILNQMSQAAS